MSRERVRRAERVVELKQRAVDEAQAACADARRAVESAEEVARAALARWEFESNAPHPEGSTTDLADRSAWVRTLRLRADHAAAKVVAAKAEEARRLDDLVRARFDLRRIEMWRDGLLHGMRAVADRKERIATDEAAARTVRRPT